MGEVYPLSSIYRRLMNMRTQRPGKFLLLLVALAILATGVLALSGTFAQRPKLDLTGTETALDGTTPYSITLTHNDGSEDHPSLMTDGGVLTNQVSWCPGRSEILYLECVNNEKFPVKISMTLNVDESQFGDVFSYAVVEGNLKAQGADHPDNWKAFVDCATHRGIAADKASLPVFDDITLQPAGTDYSDYFCALGLHMSENASSEFADKNMKLSFTLTVDANYKPGEIPAE